MSSLNEYLSTVIPKLIDMTGKSENIENKNTTKKPTTKEKLYKLKERIKNAREAWKFAIELGNTKYTSNKQKLVKKLEDELESI